MKIPFEEVAEDMRQRLGGTIFSFPTEPENPFSKYVICVYTGEGYKTYENDLNINDAAGCILEILKAFRSEGIDSDYERNVRFASYDAQVNAPDVTMRKIRNTPGAMTTAPKPLFESGVDVHDRDDGEEGYYISARGLIKYSYLTMVEEKNPNAIQFMNGYYKILEERKYGKTAAAIRQEVRRMNKEEAASWIDRTYKRFIKDDLDIFDLMGIKEKLS